MLSVNDVSDMPTKSKNLIIVAGVQNVLHFRIFAADGKKVVPWAKGSLQLSPTGRASFFVFPTERAKTDSVRTPAGPMVGWYGSYTVDEAANTFTVSGNPEMPSFSPFEWT